MAKQDLIQGRERILAEIRALAEVIEPAPLTKAVCRDPDDDHVIACAIATRADAMVSGDLDLLDLGQHQGAPILTAAQALGRIAHKAQGLHRCRPWALWGHRT